MLVQLFDQQVAATTGVQVGSAVGSAVDAAGDLASEVAKNTKRVRFVAYDINLLGPHSSLDTGHPNMYLSIGNQRDREPRLYRGTPDRVGPMADFIKKHAHNKFKMNTENLDQNL